MAAEVKAYAARLSQESGMAIQIDLVSSYPAEQQPDLANEIGRRRAALQAQQ